MTLSPRGRTADSRDLLLSDQDREHIARERRAQLMLVSSKGHLTPEEARDRVICEAMHSSWGIGCMEGSLLDQMTAAQAAGMATADIEVDHAPEWPAVATRRNRRRPTRPGLSVWRRLVLAWTRFVAGFRRA